MRRLSDLRSRHAARRGSNRIHQLRIEFAARRLSDRLSEFTGGLLLRLSTLAAELDNILSHLAEQSSRETNHAGNLWQDRLATSQRCLAGAAERGIESGEACPFR